MASSPFSAIGVVERELEVAEANVARLRSLLAEMRSTVKEPADDFAGETMLEVAEAALRFDLDENTIRLWARGYGCGKKPVGAGRWLVSVQRVQDRISARKRR
ncbi:MAG: hypothetical protein E5Y73_14820 [Mesorhizobium sp.]|uniref:hypothetical protein n=1 Tax=Mesorhizobium sp. TaxID=1871066 RepID=UPI001225F3BF|nr:hypothetical protein [Mesorhizobium sp.]TIL93059.1 MAG: hypothetical protein E5Y73_14820 [Mesorhizobium sp.]